MNSLPVVSKFSQNRRPVALRFRVAKVHIKIKLVAGLLHIMDNMGNHRKEWERMGRKKISLNIAVEG